ncbi:MAG: hypothetical protein HC782_04445 [Gammaproteobacteria bacterium]|nr:hypothetical protein [Gammaproteobacteria bacterium]
MEQIDISSEQYRIYSYEDNKFCKIENPLTLYVTENGTHRIVDAQGLTHRPSPGYLLISWLPKEGAPNFVA